MNLIQQFPDISQTLRAKIKINNRSYKAANAQQSSSYIEDKDVVRYYENGFRRWHFKLLFIVAAILGIFYFALLEVGRMFSI
jgi:hypothetical protein